MGLIDELMELERAGWDSLCRREGSRFYAEVMTPEGVMVLAHGLALGREQVVESLDDAPPWSGYEISDERVVPVGEAAAALVYRARAWRPGEGADFVALMTSVYTRVDGRWRLALYQQTPVPGVGEGFTRPG